MAQTSIANLGETNGYAGSSQAQGETVISRFASESIAFGRVVEEGATAGTADLWNTGSKSPLGIAMYNKARSSAQQLGVYVADSYAQYDGMNIQKSGMIKCSINGTGAVGAALTVIDNTGQLSTAAADGTHTAVNAQLEEACGTSNDVCWVSFDFAPILALPLSALPLHASTHEDDGADEISVEGLEGTLADGQDAVSIQGVNVTTDTPTNGQVLKYNGTAWDPAADATE